MKLFSVAIPPAMRGFPDVAPASQAFDVSFEGIYVTNIDAVPTAPRGTLVSGFVDAHVHLDKTFRIDEVGPAQGDLHSAIARMARAREGWSAESIRERMVHALHQAYRSGTRAMRTHIDWPDASTPTALPVVRELHYDWESRIELQYAALTPLDVLAGPDGQAIAESVAGEGAVLGAFVLRNDDLEAKLEKVFNLATRNSLPLDFHVDETLDPDAAGLEAIAARALGRSWHGRILCSHACSLGTQPAERARATLERCARAGIVLTALPTTNLYLQGSWDGTPLERGITRLREATEAGVDVCLATDNVADAFYPYGGYDLMDTLQLGVQLGHLPSAHDALSSITVNPARAMGLEWDGRIRPGCPAHLVLLAARNEYELLTPPGRIRRIFNWGVEI